MKLSPILQQGLACETNSLKEKKWWVFVAHPDNGITACYSSSLLTLCVGDYSQLRVHTASVLLFDVLTSCYVCVCGVCV